MRWLDTPEQNRRQETHVIAGGNIKDLDRINERDRRRTINAVFWILFIVSIILGWFIFKAGFTSQSYYLFGFALLFLIILIFRYGLHRKVDLGRKSNGWERLREVPSWVPRKMRKRHSHKVRGKHYVYKKEGNTFYRRLRR